MNFKSSTQIRGILRRSARGGFVLLMAGAFAGCHNDELERLRKENAQLKMKLSESSEHHAASVKMRDVGERQSKEEERYHPENPETTDTEWLALRNNERKLKGSVLTWRVKYAQELHLSWGPTLEWTDQLCFLNDNPKRPVQMTTYYGSKAWGEAEDIAQGDWVVVTGKFEFISKEGAVVLSPTRVKREGYKD